MYLNVSSRKERKLKEEEIDTYNVVYNVSILHFTIY